MKRSPTLDFALAVRRLAAAARRQGLVVPGFRTPPRLPGADRTLRHRGSGPPTVAVRLTGRPWSAVLADLVEGVVATNGLHGPEADRARRALWLAVDEAPPIVGPPARVA